MGYEKPRLDGTYKHKPFFLKDGERRTMRPAKFFPAESFKVEAHRIDPDTPYVIVTVNGVEHHFDRLLCTRFTGQNSQSTVYTPD